MSQKVLLPLTSVGLLLTAVLYVAHAQHEAPPPALLPALSAAPVPVKPTSVEQPEANSESVAVAPSLPGIVAEVLVQVGQTVKAGDVLVRLDDRQLKAELEVRKAALEAAVAQLTRLEMGPRPEELPPSLAAVEEAKANMADHQEQLARARRLYSQRALSEEEMGRREQAARMAREQLARAKANYELLKAGAWEPDKAVARAQVALAKSQLRQTETELDRLVVRARVDGAVLRVNVGPGEYVGTPPGQALVVLGRSKPAPDQAAE